jgi:type III restriction enzyme
MRYILTDYQAAAVADLTRRLRQATREFEADGDYSSVSLTAPTGAGKTVIAAAVIERLFRGDDHAESDPAATALWITDNPSLNEQTRRKMLMASTALQPAHLVTLEASFDEESFEPNRVYFLNVQKLGQNSLLIRSKTDTRRWSLWETIGQSISALGGHLYVVIDEAHRGTGAAYKGRPTIVRRIISDPDNRWPPSPVVWGISATPERFQEAMATASSPPRTQREVRVPPEEVRASGLLKDTLDIRHPEEKQPSDATLTMLAADNLRTMSERWADYGREQDEPPVTPVLVVQVRAQESESAIATILNTLTDAWPVLAGRSIGHAFDTHATLSASGTSVRYVAPEDIQDDEELRVVLFKEALTTGWDCPRAETMLSFRKASDFTYIAQLIGRMVRTPLARRIVTDDVLNTVSLFLPHYDKASVEIVVERLRSDPDSPPIDVVRNAIACTFNKKLSEDVVDVFRALPTYVVPGKAHRSQVARLHTLATRLSGDGILEDALAAADKHLIKTIERERARLSKDGTFDALVSGLGQIDIGRLTVSLVDDSETRAEETIRTDSRDINTLFKASRRGLRDGLANEYWSWLLTQKSDEGGSYTTDEAKIVVAALATDSSVVEAVEEAAGKLVRRWLRDYSRPIAELSEARLAAYQTVRSQARVSEETPIILPSTITTTGYEDSPTWPSHLYAPAGTDFPARFNSWEETVLKHELDREDLIAWYRNPVGGTRSIRVPYRDGDVERPFYPDFVFVHQTADGLRPSIVDPHNFALADTGPKWRGLVEYAERHGDQFHRIDAVIQDKDQVLIRLDFRDSTIRTAFTSSDGTEEILQVFHEHGGNYV